MTFTCVPNFTTGVALGQLNLYGFQRIDDGPEKGGFVHQHFQKGQRSLCNKIKRQRRMPAGSPVPSANTLSLTELAAGQRREVPPIGVGVGSEDTRTQAFDTNSTAAASIPQNQQAQAVLRRLLRDDQQEEKRNTEADA